MSRRQRRPEVPDSSPAAPPPSLPPTTGQKIRLAAAVLTAALWIALIITLAMRA